jgi:hypothetical protein
MPKKAKSPKAPLPNAATAKREGLQDSTPSGGCECGCPCHTWGVPRTYEPWEKKPDVEPPHPWDVADDHKTRKPKAGLSNGKQRAPQPQLNEEAENTSSTPAMLGGPSWTGALPGAVLASLCRDRGWKKPKYFSVCAPHLSRLKNGLQFLDRLEWLESSYPNYKN